MTPIYVQLCLLITLVFAAAVTETYLLATPNPSELEGKSCHHGCGSVDSGKLLGIWNWDDVLVSALLYADTDVWDSTFRDGGFVHSFGDCEYIQCTQDLSPASVLICI